MSTSTILFLLILLALVIGFGGYWVYKKQIVQYRDFLYKRAEQYAEDKVRFILSQYGSQQQQQQQPQPHNLPSPPPYQTGPSPSSGDGRGGASPYDSYPKTTQVGAPPTSSPPPQPSSGDAWSFSGGGGGGGGNQAVSREMMSSIAENPELAHQLMSDKPLTQRSQFDDAYNNK